jgi:O-antigen/teichoic acid export membrane protein
MNLKKTLYTTKSIINNKVILYLISRYITYFIQFLSSIFIAIKFGPYYFGIWGFMLLLISYISYFNFGISNSVNIFMVQNKSNDDHLKNIVADSLVLIGIITLLIVLFTVYYFIFGIKAFEKYELGNYFYLICIIGIMFHFNSLFGTIYRVKNRLFEMAFQQSVVPLLVFISLFLATGQTLLQLLLGMYLLGTVAAIIIFIANKKIPWGGKPSAKGCSSVLKKGIYLFIYNMCFFFIVLSTRTMISIYYKVEDFGYFTFAYTLANSIFLFLEAFSIVAFPKVIDKLYSNSKENVKNVINLLKVNYVTLSYGIMFMILIVFPFFINYIPKYEGTLKALNLIAMAVLLFTNSFGHGAYLMAQNREIQLSVISLFSLCLNIAIGLVLILMLKVTYEYVIIATLISYLAFSYLSTYFSRKQLGEKTTFSSVILDFFPIRLLCPYIISVIVIGFNLTYLICLPLLSFIILNKVELNQVISTIKTIIVSPNVVDIGEQKGYKSPFNPPLEKWKDEINSHLD